MVIEITPAEAFLPNSVDWGPRSTSIRCTSGRSVICEAVRESGRKTRIEFTAREFDLLRYFVQHTGQVVTREQILNEVWGYEEFPTTRTIDNFVAKLRQKIERSPHAPEHILTIHGSGYKFVG